MDFRPRVRSKTQDADVGFEECASFTHLLIDEVHIRDAHIDFLLSLVVTRVLVQNQEVKVVLMSAAMDSDKIASYFERVVGRVPRPLDLEKCRRHQLRIWYLDDLDFFLRRGMSRIEGTWYGTRATRAPGVPAEWSQEEVADLYAEFVKECHDTRNDLHSFLVFLPGKRELTLLAERLDEVPKLQVCCIYGGPVVLVDPCFSMNCEENSTFFGSLRGLSLGILCQDRRWKSRSGSWPSLRATRGRG